VLHDHPVDQAARALQFAYSYLDRRERTTGEVRRYLLGKGFDASATEQSIASLLEERLLDDHRFARLFTTDKRELEQWGAERIRRTLLQRGVQPETIAEALDWERDGRAYHDELARALKLLQRRFAAPPRSRRDRDRALGVLVRKGYQPEIALDALAAYERES
jgi:regulatory protein